jgi:hypothetical protein
VLIARLLLITLRALHRRRAVLIARLLLITLRALHRRRAVLHVIAVVRDVVGQACKAGSCC